jgi:hypothetical protein
MLALAAPVHATIVAHEVCVPRELIAQYVNANSPGAARFVEVPEMGHTLQSYANWANAFTAKSRD